MILYHLAIATTCFGLFAGFGLIAYGYISGINSILHYFLKHDATGQCLLNAIQKAILFMVTGAIISSIFLIILIQIY